MPRLQTVAAWHRHVLIPTCLPTHIHQATAINGCPVLCTYALVYTWFITWMIHVVMQSVNLKERPTLKSLTLSCFCLWYIAFPSELGNVELIHSLCVQTVPLSLPTYFKACLFLIMIHHSTPKNIGCSSQLELNRKQVFWGISHSLVMSVLCHSHSKLVNVIQSVYYLQTISVYVIIMYVDIN